MAPTLVSGDEVLIDPRAYRHRAPAAGDVVVCLHPYQRDVRIVKRVARVEDGRCTLTGDQPDESTDSRSFGTVAFDRILGRVTARL